MPGTPKTVVITGANAGIGLASAHRLAAGGHSIVMACRN
ncbi:SDR family NAD(P)-dependent oxidoreductase, partial [Mycobacterium kansasii]